MVSGKSSKAVRSKSRGGATMVVNQKSTPWGMIAAIVVVVVFAGAIFGFYTVQKGAKDTKNAALAAFTPTADNQDPSKNIPGILVKTFAGGQHVQRNQQVAYTESPPIGGTHDFAWAACDGVVYPQAVRSENMVHAMEHGTVWIAYNPAQVSGAALDTLKAKVQGQPYTIMSPYPGLDQPISVQSWGHQVKVADAADPRIDQFIAALRQNQYVYPEPGASCDELGGDNFQTDNPPPFAPAPAPGTPGSIGENDASTAGAPDVMGGAAAPAAPAAPAVPVGPTAPANGG